MLTRIGVSHARNCRSALWVGRKKKDREEVEDIFLNLGSYSWHKKWHGKTNQECAKKVVKMQLKPTQACMWLCGSAL